MRMGMQRSLLVFATAAIAILTMVTTTKAAVGASRSARGALKLLFWATDGPSWAHPWPIQDERSDPCLDRWYGIMCDEFGRLVAIRLAANNLVGGVPAELPRPALRYLEELDLSSNAISGPLPASIAQLTGLRVLRLDRNWFNGALPPALGSLPFLEFLELQGNSFDPGAGGQVLPPEVARLGQMGQCHIIV